MKLFADEETERVFHTGFSTRCSRKIAKQAQRLMRQLMAAHAFEDVVFIAADRIGTWPGTPARFGLHVEKKWFIGFKWTLFLRGARTRTHKGADAPREALAGGIPSCQRRQGEVLREAFFSVQGKDESRRTNWRRPWGCRDSRSINS